MESEAGGGGGGGGGGAPFAVPAGGAPFAMPAGGAPFAMPAGDNPFAGGGSPAKKKSKKGGFPAAGGRPAKKPKNPSYGGFVRDPRGIIPRDPQIIETCGDCGHDFNTQRTTAEVAEIRRSLVRNFVSTLIANPDFLSFNEHKIAELLHASLNGLWPFDRSGEIYHTRLGGASGAAAAPKGGGGGGGGGGGASAAAGGGGSSPEHLTADLRLSNTPQLVKTPQELENLLFSPTLPNDVLPVIFCIPHEFVNTPDFRAVLNELQRRLIIRYGLDIRGLVLHDALSKASGLYPGNVYISVETILDPAKVGTTLKDIDDALRTGRFLYSTEPTVVTSMWGKCEISTNINPVAGGGAGEAAGGGGEGGEPVGAVASMKPITSAEYNGANVKFTLARTDGNQENTYEYTMGPNVTNGASVNELGIILGGVVNHVKKEKKLKTNRNNENIRQIDIQVTKRKILDSLPKDNRHRSEFLGGIIDIVIQAYIKGGVEEAAQLVFFDKEKGDSSMHFSGVKYGCFAAGTVDGLSIVGFLKRGVPLAFGKLGLHGKDYLRVHVAGTLHLLDEGLSPEQIKEAERRLAEHLKKQAAAQAAAKAELDRVNAVKAAEARQRAAVREEAARAEAAAAAATALARNQDIAARRAASAARRAAVAAGDGASAAAAAGGVGGGGGGGAPPQASVRSGRGGRGGGGGGRGGGGGGGEPPPPPLAGIKTKRPINNVGYRTTGPTLGPHAEALGLPPYSFQNTIPIGPFGGPYSIYGWPTKLQSGGVRWKKTERKARKYRNKTYKQKGGANILSINLILALINVLFEYSFSVARGVPGLPQECSLFRLPFVSIDPADRTDYADLTLRVQAENGEYIFVDNPLLGLPLASILYLLQEKLDDELESDYAEFIIEDFLTGFNFTESEIRILKPEILRLSNNPGSVAASSLASAPSSPPTSVSPFTRPIANIDIEQFYTMVQEYGAVIPGFTIYEEEEGGDTPAPAATVAKEAMESGGGGGGGGPSTLEPLDPFHTPPLSTGETNLGGQLPRDLLLLKLKEAAAAAGGGGMQQNLLPIQVKLAQGAARGTSVAGMGHRRGQKGGYRYKKTFKHGKSRKRTTYRKRL